jgi:hypothetical protein
MVGQAPDYNVGWPYETISTKSTGHNLRLSSAGAIVFQNRSTARMQINGNGQVDFFKGIHIKGALPTTHSYAYPWAGFWAGFNANAFINTSGNLNPVLKADGFVMANYYMAYSDERIKNIEGLSKGKEDLETLKSIEITDYVYKDQVTRGDKNHKKVIAQQVEKVFPQAVGMVEGVVPDVYQMSEGVVFDAATNRLDVLLSSHGLAKGERVRIMALDAEHEVEIAEVADSNEFTIEGWEGGNVDSVFVYGRYVDDLKTVDYEAIAMLNVSATQELSIQLETAQHTIEELKTQNQTLQSRLDRIESRLNKMSHPQTEQKAQVVSQPRSWVQNLIMWWRS